jgi:hypothetical protein
MDSGKITNNEVEDTGTLFWVLQNILLYDFFRHASVKFTSLPEPLDISHSILLHSAVPFIQSLCCVNYNILIQNTTFLCFMSHWNAQER